MGKPALYFYYWGRAVPPQSPPPHFLCHCNEGNVSVFLTSHKIGNISTVLQFQNFQSCWKINWWGLMLMSRSFMILGWTWQSQFPLYIILDILHWSNCVIPNVFCCPLNYILLYARNKGIWYIYWVIFFYFLRVRKLTF